MRVAALAEAALAPVAYGCGWGLLLTYRNADTAYASQHESRKFLAGVPQHWAERELAAGKLSAGAQRVLGRTGS